MFSNRRDFSRYREIIGVLLTHGFDYIAGELGVKGSVLWKKKFIRKKKEYIVQSFPERLRFLFEDLGPTFIKLGQLLSTRPDLVPREYIKQLEELQDNVEEVSKADVQKQFIENSGDLPENIFKEFDYEPLACASIGQVHLATLADGTRVAVKVQRPNLEFIVEKDLSILKDVSPILQNRTVLGKLCDVEEIVDVFARHIRREMDYQVEALNTETFYELFKDEPDIVVPKIYWDYTNKKIMTMDYVEGLRIEAAEQRIFNKDNRPVYARKLYISIFKPLFERGIFHGDPHPGNVLFQSEGKVLLIDFGIVGRFDSEVRRQMGQLILALAESNVALVIELILKTGQTTGHVNRQHFYEDVAEMVDKAKGVNNGDIALGQIISEMVEISLSHGIKMPENFFVLGRTVMSIEAIARKVCPEFDVFNAIKPMAVEFFRGTLQPNMLMENVYSHLYDFMQNFMALPEDIAKAVKSLAKGDTRIIFYHRNLNWLYDMLNVSSSRLVIGIILASSIIGSALVMHTGRGPLLWGFPFIGVIGFIISSLIGFWVIMEMFRHSRIK